VRDGSIWNKQSEKQRKYFSFTQRTEKVSTVSSGFMLKTTILATPENFSSNGPRKGKLATKLSSDKESRVSLSFSFMLCIRERGEFCLLSMKSTTPFLIGQKFSRDLP
jgi:hypothetical protein